MDDWNNIPAKAYPTEVTILEKVPFTLKAPNGQIIGSSDAAPGTPVAPLRIQGEMLTVASLANKTMVSEIALDKTDFKDRVQNHYDAFVANTRRRVDGVRAKARQNLLANATALDALRASGAVQWDSKDDPRFGPVKASLANGDVKAFSLEEAVSFKWNGSERIDGDLYKGTYDTVTVKYEAQTIFGRFPGEVKCLLQAGQVKGWIDPVTMEEKI